MPFTEDYFKNDFPSQLGRLNLRRPNEIVRNQIMADPSVLFFGGPDWSSVNEDLALILADDTEAFTLSLFMIVLTDQALYTHFNESYETWRGLTNFPKFGWSGFGPHHVNPLKLLWAPERDSLINTDSMLTEMSGFVDFLVDQTRSFFGQHLPAVNVDRYFTSIQNDPDFEFNEGIVVPEFKRLFLDKTSSRN